MIRAKLQPAAMAAAILFLGLPLAAGAQSQGAGSTDPNAHPPGSTTSSAMPRIGAPPTGLPAADREFVDKAARINMNDVQMGELAQKKASNDRVKQFAQRMVQEHGKSNDDLKQIAGSKGFDLPSKLGDWNREDIQKLQGLSGGPFDQQYMKMMLDDHRENVAEFARQTTVAQDENVRKFAEKMLPVLQEQLKSAEQIARDVGVKSETAGKDGSSEPRTAGATGPATTAPGMQGSGETPETRSSGSGSSGTTRR